MHDAASPDEDKNESSTSEQNAMVYEVWKQKIAKKTVGKLRQETQSDRVNVIGNS